MRYRDDFPDVLKGVSASIAGGEKIGIVGRTGAGKSSIAALIFRLVEASGGQILIDGVDCATVGLGALRRAITVIPQDPVLMAGTIRHNLDPFNQYSDEAIAAALKKAQLDPAMAPIKVAAGGTNLSAGQRQLLCFARAFLSVRKIVLLDEPTASCDQATDNQVQALVETEFADSTVLTIAHRLNTIVTADRILVMRDGQVAEFGTPEELAGRPESEFSAAIEAVGGSAGQDLRRAASTGRRRFFRASLALSALGATSKAGSISEV